MSEIGCCYQEYAGHTMSKEMIQDNHIGNFIFSTQNSVHGKLLFSEFAIKVVQRVYFTSYVLLVTQVMKYIHFSSYVNFYQCSQ